MENKPYVVFMWEGLPDYGARLIRCLIDHGTFEVHIVATHPQVPIRGMEQSLGQAVHWIAEDDKVTWKSLGLKVPDVIFQGGWAQSNFVDLARHARAQGSKIILMNDQNWQGGFKQRLVDRGRFYLQHSRNFDAVFVPGISGAKYAQLVGFQNSRIVTGLYGADPTVFHGGIPLHERPKNFLFVGQLIERKNILALVQAFINMAPDFPDWRLNVCGSGKLESQIQSHTQIDLSGFAQPSVLADKMRNSRCLILPSHEEHWGLVVHEAASCGCALALSEAVGSRDDFAHTAFSPRKVLSIEMALRKVASWTNNEWHEQEKISRVAAKNFGPEVFAKSAQLLIDGVLQ